MKMIDPTYLRLICDELKSGKLDEVNKSALPIGISSFFDRIFDVDNTIIHRSDLLDKFISMALLRTISSPYQVSNLTASSIKDWQEFFQQYSRYFSLDIQGNYMLFHDRFMVYLFQRSNLSAIKRNARKILRNIDFVDDHNWVVENKGYFLFLNEKIEDLFVHISAHKEQQLKSWWIKDLERLLIGLYSNRDFYDIDYTLLCDLLRGCFDFMVQRKGVRLIVMNSGKIEWDELNSFFDTTRFQYELALEFSKHIGNLPKNWAQMFLNENHPCSYTFSYVWKYAHFNLNHPIDRSLVSMVWREGSPYQRIIVIMIWGYRKLNNIQDEWFDDLIALKNDWHYLLIERDMWIFFHQEKQNLKYELEFEYLKSKFDKCYHYILNGYWSLYDEIEQLTQDVNYLWKHAYGLNIALWIYRHPVWEIGKIANEIVINRLRVKEMRDETISWLLVNWESEEFYALGEVIFELKAYVDVEDFFNLVRKLIHTNNSQIRGSFISDLIVYLEGVLDKEFNEIICNDFLPSMILKASDIWEVQELIRLLKFLMHSGTLTEVQSLEYITKLEIARDIDNALHLDYNEFWKQAEINNGIIR